MKKILIATLFLVNVVAFAQVTHRPLYVYNYTQFEVEFQINTVEESGDWGDYPILKSDNTYVINPYSNFEKVNLSVDGVAFAAPSTPAISTWDRKTSSTASWITTPPTVAQAVFGPTQKWHFIKKELQDNGLGSYLNGNVGFPGNSQFASFDEETLGAPYNVTINVEWFEVTDNSDPANIIITTYILFTEF
ncbi:hypothetical protein GCM10022271_04680 [Corallibacter vietnamensis]|uniref:Uncharacterized protein n=1 Tax=Corallibacter vietnamensis TaxID=904130 RepID=A0ABP7GTN8_9FLAO